MATLRTWRQRIAPGCLQDALVDVERLQALLPMGAWCRRRRSDDDRWATLEESLDTQVGSRASHGICPDCERTVEGQSPP